MQVQVQVDATHSKRMPPSYPVTTALPCHALPYHVSPHSRNAVSRSQRNLSPTTFSASVFFVRLTLAIGSSDALTEATTYREEDEDEDTFLGRPCLWLLLSDTSPASRQFD